MIGAAGLFSLSPSTEFTCREILNFLSLSKEGIDAVLVVFSARNRLTEEEKSALFGSEVVDYMIVVFTNEDALEDDGETLEEYLNDSSDFKVKCIFILTIGLETSARRFSLSFASLIELFYCSRKFSMPAMIARCCLETGPKPLRVRKLSKLKSS